MQKKWKKIIAVWCAATMLMTMPGMYVLADEMQEEAIVTEAEVSEDAVDSVDSLKEDVTDETKEETISFDETEKVVGEGWSGIQVGDGVTADCFVEDGIVLLSSQGGVLWRDWVEKLGDYRNDISSIEVEGTVYLPTDLSHMFEGWSSLRRLDMSIFDISNVTDMSSMFRWCEKLYDLDMSGIDTSNVTDMSYMFEDCESLHNLDMSGIDTSNVTNMEAMFSGCDCLTNLDLSSFDTSNVTDMNHMFGGLGYDYLVYNHLGFNLDLSNFDTSNVTNMRGMFSGCRAKNLNLSNFDTSNVTDMAYMFNGCSNLTSLDVSRFNTSNVTDMSDMFSYCSNLTNLDLSSFDTSNVTDMSDMFSDCSNLTNLDLSGFDTSKVTQMVYMFYNCNSLTDLDLSGFVTSNIGWGWSDMFEMIRCCTALQLLKTPKKNVIMNVTLPCIMYDEAGNEYEELPTSSESIILTRNKPTTKTDISDCEITLSTTSYTYDGKAKEPTVALKNGEAVLRDGTDYTVTYADNINAGAAAVKVTGTGNYKGEKSVTFTINKADAKLVFAESTVTKKTTDTAFTNELAKTTDGTISFKSSDTKVATVDGTSGKVTIKGEGTATITATASEGKNYKAGSIAYSLTVETPAPTPTPTVTGFSDVQDPSHPYYKAIYWAAEEGITKGYSDGTFGINRSCTRGEMMMFLWRYAGEPSPKTVSKSPFKDVPKTHTFYKAILWGSQEGITKGYPDGTFGIKRNVSRGECMMFLWRLKGKPAPTAVAKSPFKDVPKTHAFYNAILWGAQKKVTTGYTSGAKKGTFGINENCTRGQIVTFLYRAKSK